MSEGVRQTLAFAYDRSDFIALSKLGQRRIVVWLFRLGYSLIAFAALLIAICLLVGWSGIWLYVPVLLALLAAFLLLQRYGPNIGGWTIHRMARRNDLLREQRMTVADDCFRAESSRGTTEVRWSAVPRVHSDHSRLFVYSTRSNVFIVPERAFPSRDLFLDFIADARRQWEQHRARASIR